MVIYAYIIHQKSVGKFVYKSLGNRNLTIETISSNGRLKTGGNTYDEAIF